MKAFVLALLLISAVCASEVQNDPIHNVLDALNGFFGELNKKNDVNDICQCLSEVPKLVTKVEKFIEDFKKMEWKQFEKIMDLFIDFFTALKEIYQGLIPCINVPKDLGHLIDLLGKLDMDKLMKRILKYSFQIFTWVTDAIKDLQDKKYFEFGQGIGRMAYLFLLSDEVEA